MFAFLFWLCVIGVPLLWAATTIDRDADDPVGQLLQRMPKVLTQPHLLPVALRDPADAGSGAGTSPGESPPEVAAPSPSAEGRDQRAGRRRPLFDAPAERDDLKRISGIGPVMERHLNELGVVSFAQLAAFSEEDVARVDAALADFHGRIVRDDWVGQARAIVAGDEET